MDVTRQLGTAQPLYDVYLSYNSADNRAVEEIARRLRADGLNPFLDKWRLVPGKAWQTELAEALNRSECAAIFFGPSGEGHWHHAEMQVALNKATRTRDDYRIIPVLLPGSDPAQVDSFLGLRTWVDFRAGLDDDVAFQRLTAAVQGVAPDGTTFELSDNPRPYRGIERFEGEQHEFFFGRDNEIRRLIERLEQERFVAVVGASGSGKSSLARAGLFTQAAQQTVRGVRNWRRITCLPKNNPLLQLATNLVAHLPEHQRPALVKAYLADFRAEPTGLITALTTLFPRPDSPVLLLVDQFEELFTQRPKAAESQAEWRAGTECFAANLRATLETRPEWLRIIVTLRADFVDRFVRGEFPDFRELLEQRQFWLGEMSKDDLREVIVRPATQRGAFFERGLVERILDEMRGQTSALPLLEEALDTLWNKRHGPWLTHIAYDESGGVGGALADKADRIFKSLSDSDQAIVRRVFLELVQLGEGTHDTRRRSPVASLPAATDDPSHVRAVIERFSTTGVRLLTFSSEGIAEGDVPPDETVEVTHEALIRHWDMLARWLDESRDELRFQRRLDEAARRWKTEAAKPDGKPDGLLWRPPDLDVAREFAGNRSGGLTRLQLDFYQSSERAEEERISQVEQARRKEAEQLRREKRLMRISAAVVLTAGAIVLGLFYLTYLSHRNAQLAKTRAETLLQQANAASIRLLVSQSYARRVETPQLAVLLAAEALKLAEEHKLLTTVANQALRDALNNCGGLPFLAGHMRSVNTVAISPDGRWLATGGDDTTARLWDLSADDPATRNLALAGHQGAIHAVAFSPDGRWLATASDDTTARLWDLTSGDPSAGAIVLSGHTKAIRSIAISADNHWVLTGSEDETARRWDLTDGDPTNTGVELRHADRVWSVAISPDGRAATGCEDGEVRLWNLTVDDPSADVDTLSGHSASVNAVAFSPDSRWLVTASDDMTARRWDLATPDPSTAVLVLNGHESKVTCLAISPDSRRLVTASDDRTARRWDLAEDDPSSGHALLRGHDGPIRSVAFSPDSGWFVTASKDNTARRWDCSAKDPSSGGVMLRGHHELVLGTAISRDSRWLVTASTDATARRWDLSADDPSTSAVEMKGHQDAILAVAISPNSRWLVTASSDKTARRWDLTADDPSSTAVTLHGHLDQVSSLAISPDSRWLITGSEDRTARLWDLAADDPSATSVKMNDHANSVMAVAIGPDGSRIATAGGDGRVLLWDFAPADLQSRVAVDGHQGEIFAVEFSRNGRWLATASEDKTARLLDLNSGNPSATGLVLAGHGDDVNAVVFSPDGHWLATTSDDETVRVWDLTADDPSAIVVVLGGQHGRVFSAAISADSRWLAAACGDRTLLWDLTSLDPDRPVVLNGHQGLVFSVAISTDGRWLATGNNSGTTMLWALSTEQLLRHAEHTAGRNFDAEEWREYFPGRAYEKSFAALPDGVGVSPTLND